MEEDGSADATDVRGRSESALVKKKKKMLFIFRYVNGEGKLEVTVKGLIAQ